MSSAFKREFRHFADCDPYPWQERLFEQMSGGEIPAQLAIPTGLGKTSVMLIWLLALARQWREGPWRTLPRRLVYVVNRRTVVDQATTVAMGIRAKLRVDCPEAEAVRAGLQRCTAAPHSLLAISTLRGEFADNGEWKEDPSRPAIIVGTVDMIGSKLLFAGYGDGRRRRPFHAGLLGQDVLLIHDEAHLDPAFAHLLESIAGFQQHWPPLPGRPRALRVLPLSASLLQDREGAFRLGPEDQQHPAAQARLHAIKALNLQEAESDEVPQRLAELAAQYEGQPVRVLVFARSPQDIQNTVIPRLRKLVGSLEKRLAVLTGTMRGRERDALLQDEVVSQFLEEKKGPQTVYLLATSAGEVGVDLDADHLVSDLAPLDSLIQRIGRVNRRGGRCAQVHVVIPKEIQTKDPLASALAKTHELLSAWVQQEGGSTLSPSNLSRLVEQLPPEVRAAAFSPAPDILPLTTLHLDGLAATSLESPAKGTPAVSRLLHGVTVQDPDVFVFWRQELTHLQEAADASFATWFEVCPPTAAELVRLPWVVWTNYLNKIAARQPNSTDRTPVAVLRPGRPVEKLTVADLLKDPKSDRCAFAQVALPVALGGFDAATGMVDPLREENVPDVAEDAASKVMRRRLVREADAEGGERFFSLLGQQEVPPLGWKLAAAVPLHTDEEGQITRFLVLFTPPEELPQEDAETVTALVSLADHTACVVAWARRLADLLKLPQGFREALEHAASHHDLGKESPLWQYYAHGEESPVPLAKAVRYRSPRVLGGFRHELASARRMSLGSAGDLSAILARHLVASHHGWGRPAFAADCRDPDQSPGAHRRLLLSLANDFALLQGQLGWWTLAWLEAVMRCADALASRHGTPPPLEVQP